MRSALLDAYDAYRFVLGRPGKMIRFGLWPLIAAIVMVLVLNPFAGASFGLFASFQAATGVAAAVTVLFLAGLPWSWFATVFAIRWHRLVLLGEDRTTGFQAAFGQRVGQFFIWICALELISAVGLMAVSFPLLNLIESFASPIPDEGGLLTWIGPILYTVAFTAIACGAYAVLLSQIGLFFPSIAIDVPSSWGKIWRMAEGRRPRNVLTLFFVALGPAEIWTLTMTGIESRPETAEVVMLVPGGGTETISGQLPGLARAALTYILGLAITMVTIAATAVALSNKYQSATGAAGRARRAV